MKFHLIFFIIFLDTNLTSALNCSLWKFYSPTWPFVVNATVPFATKLPSHLNNESLMHLHLQKYQTQTNRVDIKLGKYKNDKEVETGIKISYKWDKVKDEIIVTGQNEEKVSAQPSAEEINDALEVVIYIAVMKSDTFLIQIGSHNPICLKQKKEIVLTNFDSIAVSGDVYIHNIGFGSYNPFFEDELN